MDEKGLLRSGDLNFSWSETTTMFLSVFKEESSQRAPPRAKKMLANIKGWQVSSVSSYFSPKLVDFLAGTMLPALSLSIYIYTP